MARPHDNQFRESSLALCGLGGTVGTNPMFFPTGTPPVAPSAEAQRTLVMKTRLPSASLTLVALLALAASAAPLAAAEHFAWFNLDSDIHGVAPYPDPNLVNPWGLAHLPDKGFWVANNGTGTLTHYDAAGKGLPLGAPVVVTVPPPAGAVAGRDRRRDRAPLQLRGLRAERRERFRPGARHPEQAPDGDGGRHDPRLQRGGQRHERDPESDDAERGLQGDGAQFRRRRKSPPLCRGFRRG